jgi:hypothetical protein
MAENTQPVKILEKTYHLPLLRNEHLHRIQARLRDRQRIIQTGKRSVPALLGLTQREISLSSQEQMGELQEQINDYRELVKLQQRFPAGEQSQDSLT